MRGYTKNSSRVSLSRVHSLRIYRYNDMMINGGGIMFNEIIIYHGSKEARSLYRKERTVQRLTESVYLLDILRGGWENDDARIRRNISE
jgi:hypothetical protein